MTLYGLSCGQTQRIHVHEEESAEADQGEGGQVCSEGEAVVGGVPAQRTLDPGQQWCAPLPGEGVPRPQLLQHELRPPLPLHVLALLLPAAQLGPDVVEVAEQLPGG